MTHDKKRLLSIGEAAKALEVTRRMILNYEDKGLILPDQRDGINGNRYYTADTVSRIRSIRILQNLGLSLDDIYAYYHGTTDLEPLITRLEDLRNEISRNIEKLKEHSKGHNDFEIRQIELPAQTVYCQMCIRDRVYIDPERLENTLTGLLDCLLFLLFRKEIQCFFNDFTEFRGRIDPISTADLIRDRFCQLLAVRFV